MGSSQGKSNFLLNLLNHFRLTSMIIKMVSRKLTSKFNKKLLFSWLGPISKISNKFTLGVFIDLSKAFKARINMLFLI